MTVCVSQTWFVSDKLHALARQTSHSDYLADRGALNLTNITYFW